MQYPCILQVLAGASCPVLKKSVTWRPVQSCLAIGKRLSIGGVCAGSPCASRGSRCPPTSSTTCARARVRDQPATSTPLSRFAHATLHARRAPTGSPQKSSAGGTDGGWIHSTPLKTRYASPTGLMSFDGESAWSQYDPHALVPKEWGKQVDNWKGSLREFEEPAKGMWTTGQAPTWKSVNYKRWPLHRVPKYDRTGIEVSL